MENTNENYSGKKLYSKLGIGIATFFGSFLGASILMRHNYRALGKEYKGKEILYLGILSTILFFSSLLIIPEDVISMIPSNIIPFLVVSAVYFFVDKKQGKELAMYEKNKHTFISNWKAAGIGLFSMFLIFIGLFFGFMYLLPAV